MSAWLEPALEVNVLRHVPVEVARLLQEPPHRHNRRQRVFLVLWFAGYEMIHAAALAGGPQEEVDDLWRAAGCPSDATLARMVIDASTLASLADPRIAH